jgi:16S rRNA (guanine966-N2)-methyltransferase
MRIVAGKFRGKNLAPSTHLKLRPTTDKNRESLFNILSSAKFIKEIGFEIVESKVLDLCCGTGAVGFEALSRGAKSVTFIDNDSAHLDLVAKNSKSLGVENCAKIMCLDAKNLPKSNENFDLIFVDPPYSADYLAIMESLLKSGFIKEKTLIVIEFSIDAKLENIFAEKIKFLNSRSYGKTMFWFGCYLL